MAARDVRYDVAALTIRAGRQKVSTKLETAERPATKPLRLTEALPNGGYGSERAGRRSTSRPSAESARPALCGKRPDGARSASKRRLARRGIWRRTCNPSSAPMSNRVLGSIQAYADSRYAS